MESSITNSPAQDDEMFVDCLIREGRTFRKIFVPIESLREIAVGIESLNDFERNNVIFEISVIGRDGETEMVHTQDILMMLADFKGG